MFVICVSSREKSLQDVLVFLNFVAPSAFPFIEAGHLFLNNQRKRRFIAVFSEQGYVFLWVS